MIAGIGKSKKHARMLMARAAKTAASCVVVAAMVVTMMPAGLALAIEEPEQQAEAPLELDESQAASDNDQPQSVAQEPATQEESVADASSLVQETLTSEQTALDVPEFTNPTFSGGSGTVSDPYRVSTAADLKAMSDAVAAEHSYAGEYFKLTADIDTTGSGFVPVGYYVSSSSTPFAGSFDGDGHSVTLALSLNDRCGIALFGYAGGANSNVPARITNVTVKGTVSSSNSGSGAASTSGQYVAGIVGCAKNVEVENCVNEASITGYMNVGGIVGSNATSYNDGDFSYVSIRNCANKGDVKSSYIYGPGQTGGIIGLFGPTERPSALSNCYNIGTVRGDNMIGGLIGRACAIYQNGDRYSWTVEKCFSAGNVVNNSNNIMENNINALIGSVETTSGGNVRTLTGCYAAEGSCILKGVPKSSLFGYVESSMVSTCEFKTAEFMRSYDFIELMGSAFIQSDGYPILRAENPHAPVIGRLQTAGIDSLSRCAVGRSATLVASASTPDGQGTLSYEWYKSTDEVLDPTDDEKLTSTSAQVTVSESSPCTVYYYCQVTNTVGSASAKIKSAPVKIIYFEQVPIATPTITTQPADGQASQDQSPHTLSVAVNMSAAGIGDITYQWYRCTSASSRDDAEVIEGATAATYAAPADYAGTYYFYCKITNTFNVETTTTDSNIATVTVNPTVINTPADLIALSDRVTGYDSTTSTAQDLEGKTFVLGNDINMSGQTIRPIGSYATYANSTTAPHPFKGVFDGAGHSITGLNIEYSSASGFYTGYYGLFGYVENATIKNLRVTGNVSDPEHSYVGGIVGYARGGCVLENLSFEGSVTANTRAGGIVGYLFGTSESFASVSNCLSRATVTATSFAGGIAGAVSSTNIASCYNWGAVTVSAQSGYAGGIAGSAGYFQGSNNVSISSCYNVGTIKTTYPSSFGTTPYVGAIAGDGFGYSSYPNYYLEGSAPTTQGAPGNSVVAKSDSEMRSAAFVTTLNTGHATAPYMRNTLGGYPLLSWETQGSATQLNLTLAPDQVADAEVSVIDANGNPCFALVDPTLAANKRVYSLLNGTYTIKASRYGYLDFSQVITIDGSSPSTNVTVTMQQSPSATVQFNLSAQDGASTSGARMWLKSEKYGWIHQGDEIASISGFDASTGAYAGIPAGDYTYAFVLENHQSVKGSFTVASAGQAVTQNVSFPAPTPWNGTTVEPVAYADGTYVVTNGHELAWIAAHVNGSASQTDFELAADIILGGEGSQNTWTPIGTGTWPYAGNFDGRGHVISALYIDSTDDNLGLFGIAQDATFKNVILAGTIRTTGENAAGLVAGINHNATIDNVGNHVDVEGSVSVGGIVASVVQTSVEMDSVQIRNCYNKGDITASERNWYTNNCVGGIAGQSRGSNYDTFKMVSCYNLGTVNGGAVGAGGLLGTGGVSLEHSFNAGDVILGTYSDVYQNCSGALIGWPPENGLQVSTNNVYYLEGSSPRPYGYVNSVPGYAANKFTRAADIANPSARGLIGFTAASGTFNEGYPYLAWESPSTVIPSNPGLIGSEDNPYVIQTADELIAFSNDVKAGNTYAGRYVELRADIDLAGCADDFNPIGDYERQRAFEGYFNGNGHAIKNLDIHRVSPGFSDAGCGVGLFGYTRHATITRVEVTGSISGSNWVGGVVGYAYDTHVSNCLSRVDVSVASDKDGEGNYGAGVVGQSYSSADGSGSVTSCVYYGKVVHPENKLWGAITTLGTSSSTITANYYLSTQNDQGTDKKDSNGTTGVPTFDDKVISWYLNTADGTIDNTLIWGNKSGEGVMFANGNDVIATYRILMDQTPAFITADPEFVQAGETAMVTIQQLKKGYTLTGAVKVSYTASTGLPEETKDVSGQQLPYSFNLTVPNADIYVSADYSFDQNTLFDLRANVTDAAGNTFASGADVVFLNAQGNEITQAKRGDKIVALVKAIDANSQYHDATATEHYGSGAFQSAEAMDVAMIAYGRAFELTVGDADVEFTLALEPKGTAPNHREETLAFEQTAFHIGDANYAAAGEYVDRDFIIDGDADSGVTGLYYDVYYDPYPAQDVSTVASIESAPSAMRYSQRYSFLDADGTRSTGVYTGIDIGAYLMRYYNLNPNLSDSTQVTFIASDGKKVALTVGELRTPQRNSYCIADDASGYAKRGDFTARGVPIMLAASKDGVPFAIGDGGPLKLIVGQKDFDDENGTLVLDDVRKIVVGNDAAVDTSMHDAAPFSRHLEEYVLIDVYRNDELVEEGVRLTLREIEDCMKDNPTSRESVWANAARFSDGGVWSGYGDEPDHYQGVNIWTALQAKLGLTEYDLAYEGATATFCEEPFQGNNRYTPVVTTSLRYLAGGENGDYRDNAVTYGGRITSGVPAQLTTAKNGMPLTKFSNEQGTVEEIYNFRGPIMAMLPLNAEEGVVQKPEVIEGGYETSAYAVSFLGKIILHLGEAADKGPLQELYDTASAFTDVTVSADGSDTADDELWIDPFSMQLLTEALDKAKGVLDDNKAGKDDVDGAYLQLNTAFDSFVAALQYGSALTRTNLSVDKSSFMGAVRSNGEVVGVDSLSTPVNYSGDGELKVWATDPNVAEASYDRTTGTVSIKPKGAGTTTINVFVAPSATYAGAGAKITVDVAAVRFKGGSLRVDYPDDASRTAMRLGYEIGLPEGYEASWQWKCSTDESLSGAVSVMGKNYKTGSVGTLVSNVVFTNVNASDYDERVFAQMSVTITKNGIEVLRLDDVAHSRCVTEIAESVIASDKESASSKKYAQAVLDAAQL